MIPYIPEIVPDILQALVFTLAFTAVFAKPLRKHPLPFYVVFIAAAILTFPDLASVNQVAYTLVNLLASCYTGVAFYLLVMFAGALPNKWGLTKLLYSVRSQLSILAGFIIVAHVAKVIFFVPMSFTAYWPLIWHGAYPIMFVASTVVGVPLLVCFLAPWITSFPRVRKGMTAAKWKSIQRLAYPFMALLVLQGALLAAGHAVYVGAGSERFAAYAATGITYVVIGVLYLVLKIYKVARMRKKRAVTQEADVAKTTDAATAPATTDATIDAVTVDDAVDKAIADKVAGAAASDCDENVSTSPNSSKERN